MKGSAGMPIVMAITGASGAPYAVRTNENSVRLITPFIVKNAAFNLERSPGRTSECSYASSDAATATPIQ